jgi:CRISPR-associated RAMP protein (TIGR02581 family)
MFKKLVCDCSIDYNIEPVDPILVKSGQATVHGVDMSFVLTYRHGQWEPFIPGTSIKGVFRSHSERIAGTLNENFVCNPFVEQFCGKLFEKRKKKDEKSSNQKGEKLSNQAVYHDSCPICRIFGSTEFAGRLAPSDAYVDGEYAFERRDGVGIDRFTGGGAHGAKFDLEVLSRGTFSGNIMLRNFELGQLGLLAFLFRDLEEGYIRIGTGTSRGLGRIKGSAKEIRISYLSPNPAALAQNELVGVGELAGEEGYGFAKNDRVPLELPEYEDLGVRKRLIFKGEDIQRLWRAVAPKWNEYIFAYKMPPAMEAVARVKLNGGDG